MNKHMVIEKINNLNLGTEDSGYPLEDYSQEKLETLLDDLTGVTVNETEKLRVAFDKLES